MEDDGVSGAPGHRLNPTPSAGTFSPQASAIPVDEDGIALWNRIIFLSFPRIYTNDPKKLKLPGHFPMDDQPGEKPARNPSGILKWLVIGAREWYDQGLNLPKAVMSDITSSYYRINILFIIPS